jgi:hypothetical protein
VCFVLAICAYCSQGVAGAEALLPQQDTPPPSCSRDFPASPPIFLPEGRLTAMKSSQWADFAHRLRGSPTPSASSHSSATTADTFLLEDVSILCSRTSWCSHNAHNWGRHLGDKVILLRFLFDVTGFIVIFSWMRPRQWMRRTSLLILQSKMTSLLVSWVRPPLLMRTHRRQAVVPLLPGDLAVGEIPSVLFTVCLILAGDFR